MYRRDAFARLCSPDPYQNDDYWNRKFDEFYFGRNDPNLDPNNQDYYDCWSRHFSEAFVRHNQSHWMSNQDSACPFCCDGYDWLPSSHREGPTLPDLSSVKTSSTDFPKEIDENQNHPPKVILPDDDLRHYLNRRRRFNGDRKKSTISGSSKSSLDMSLKEQIPFDTSPENIPSFASKTLKSPKHRPKRRPITVDAFKETVDFPTPPKRRLTTSNWLANNFPTPTKTTVLQKQKPVTFCASPGNISQAAQKSSFLPKPKPITFNSSKENISQVAQTSSYPPKHKPITFKSSTENLSHTAGNLPVTPKHKPITFKSSTENPSHIAKNSSVPKHLEPIIFKSSNENIPQVAHTSSYRPKHKPITFKSSTENLSHNAQSSSVPKHKPITFKSSNENLSLTLQNTSYRPKHKRITFKSSTENLCQVALHSSKERCPTNLVSPTKQVTFEDDQDKELLVSSDRNEVSKEKSQVPDENAITTHMLLGEHTSSESIFTTSNSLAATPIQLLSPQMYLGTIEEFNRMDDTSTVSTSGSESSLSEAEYLERDVKPSPAQLDFSTILEEPTSTDQVNGRSSAVDAVLEVLTCSICKKWAYSGKVLWCKCHVICRSCKKKASDDTCDQCETSYEADARLVNFHERIANLISHPCRYRACSEIVTPGITHEEICRFSPTKCFICNESIPSVFLRLHFDEEHPNRVLTNKNFDVKFSVFIKVEGTDRREVFCFTRGLLVLITLNKVNSEPYFIVTTPNTKDPPSNVIVTFEFIGTDPPYEFKRKVAIRNDFIGGLDEVGLPDNIFMDWCFGKSKLNITLTVNRRKILDI